MANGLTTSPQRSAGSNAISTIERVSAIDALRGLVVALMVLDHVRDFFTVPIDPLALDSGNPALFLTRWITHLCAPTFVFLAGTSVWLQRGRRRSRPELSRFLVTRGLWLIALEVAVIGVAFNFGWWLFLQVIWAIGSGFILLAGLHWLPRLWVLALGLALLLLQPLLPRVPLEAFGDLDLLWRAVAVFGPAESPFGFTLIAYPTLPWLAIMLIGYGLGPVFAFDPARRRRWIAGLAVGALLAFAILRGMNVPGLDPRPWATQGEPLWTLFSVLNVSKYPPSLAYALVTLGLAFLAFLFLERLPTAIRSGLTTFGRTPLFTYLIHVWLAHGLALAVGLALGIPPGAFLNSLTDPQRLIEAGWGFGLGGVYLAWVVTLALLYPLSRWFEKLKQRRSSWWTSYL